MVNPYRARMKNVLSTSKILKINRDLVSFEKTWTWIWFSCHVVRSGLVPKVNLFPSMSICPRLSGWRAPKHVENVKRIQHILHVTGTTYVTHHFHHLIYAKTYIDNFINIKRQNGLLLATIWFKADISTILDMGNSDEWTHQCIEQGSVGRDGRSSYQVVLRRALSKNWMKNYILLI